MAHVNWAHRVPRTHTLRSMNNIRAHRESNERQQRKIVFRQRTDSSWFQMGWKAIYFRCPLLADLTVFYGKPKKKTIKNLHINSYQFTGEKKWFLFYCGWRPITAFYLPIYHRWAIVTTFKHAAWYWPCQNNRKYRRKKSVFLKEILSFFRLNFNNESVGLDDRSTKSDKPNDLLT